jgi:hypothetical protein
MTAVLTYHLRSGRLSAMASGKVFYLPTYQERSRITVWEKVQELRSGRHTLWDHCFELPHQRIERGQSIPDSVPAGKVIHRLNPGSSKLEVYDFPGRFAQRFDGDDKVPGVRHTHWGTAIYVGDRRGGLYIHGWPPCDLQRCVVVMQRWEDVLQAIVGEPELSFSIEY